MQASLPACTPSVVVSVAMAGEGAPKQVQSTGCAGFGDALGEKGVQREKGASGRPETVLGEGARAHRAQMQGKMTKMTV
jgi:hypothetical protein